MHDSFVATPSSNFRSLNLLPEVQQAVDALGYTKPTPIQMKTIPELLRGKDVFGLAQTGTGKTAAFALPLLSKVDKKKCSQILVLTPTRELAIQVADSFTRYSTHLEGVSVAAICGGQSYQRQISMLKRGAQIVVGTPGRIMDLMRQKILTVDKLKALVLDEADEMLKMNFLQDIKWIFQAAPEKKQVALFSATTSREINKVANSYLDNPENIVIKSESKTSSSVEQMFICVKGDKMDALLRMLDINTPDASIIFVKTKSATLDVSAELCKNGFKAAALNGDVIQSQREKTIDSLKKGKIDILVATDVAARGIDVARVSHVFNYDAPFDSETYVHRIGRTGRAGRSGQAILFVTRQELRVARNIERATKTKITEIELPSIDEVNTIRVNRFKDKVSNTVSNANLDIYKTMLDEIVTEDSSAKDVAAAVIKILDTKQPILLKPRKVEKKFSEKRKSGRRSSDDFAITDRKTAVYKICVGRKHRVKPQNIVGAIANSIKISSRYIGNINIEDSYSTVVLPDNLRSSDLKILSSIKVLGTQLRISRYQG